jgi:hypothetical protein
MNYADFLRERVYTLSERFSWLGIGSDIAALTLSELEGVYRFLRRIAGE